MSAAPNAKPLSPIERAALSLNDPDERRSFLLDHRRAYDFLREAQRIRRAAWARWRQVKDREAGQ